MTDRPEETPEGKETRGTTDKAGREGKQARVTGRDTEYITSAVQIGNTL